MTDKHDDPLAGVETDRHACNSCENTATEPGKNHTFVKDGSAYRHFCKQQKGWTRLLPEPAARKAFVEWLRGEYREINRKMLTGRMAKSRFNGGIAEGYFRIADRLEAGGGERGGGR